MERSLEYDLDFFYNQPRVEIYIDVLSNPKNKTYILNNIIKFSKKFKKFYIITVHEKIQDLDLLQSVIQLIDDLRDSGNEVYLCSTTSTNNKNLLNPLLSILHYKNFGKVSDSSDNLNRKKLITLSDHRLFESDIDKKHKSILSIRRKTNERDLFFNLFHKQFDGIFRYIASDTDVSKYPTFTELIDEYKSSYISFIFETNVGFEYELNPYFYLNSFTEKSFIAFSTKTLPILYLKNEKHLFEFKSMGFFLLNDYFGYNDVYASMDEKNKVSKLIEVIDEINSLSDDEVTYIYNKHKKQIENNFKIVQDIIKSKNKMSNIVLKLNKNIL